MKQTFSVLLFLFVVAGTTCSASDAQVEASKIIRSPVSIECHAEADSAGVAGSAWQKVVMACMRKNSVPNPHKELAKRCLADAEGKKGEEWKQFVLACIAPALEVTSKARVE